MNLPTRPEGPFYESLLAELPEDVTLGPRSERELVLHSVESRLAQGLRLVILLAWALAFMGGFAMMALSLVRIGGWALLGVLPVLLAAVAIGGIALYVGFARHSLRLDDTALTVEYRVFGYRWNRTCLRSEIAAVEEIESRDEDHFSSWGLRIQGPARKIRIPFPTSHDGNRWIGQLIAAWAGVEFLPAPGFARDARPRKKDLGLR